MTQKFLAGEEQFSQLLNQPPQQQTDNQSRKKSKSKKKKERRMTQETTALLNGYTYTPAKVCHSGNTELMAMPDTGGGLFFGGLSRGVTTSGYAVIDLTGHKEPDSDLKIKPMNEAATSAFSRALGAAVDTTAPRAWLRLPIRDYGTPENLDRKFWLALKNDILTLMKQGEKVVVFCQGGHGRTGMVAAILCHLMNPTAVGNDPVGWVREKYCEECVETAKQHEYVHRILKLPEPDVAEYAPKVKTYQAYSPAVKDNPQTGVLVQIEKELSNMNKWFEREGDFVVAVKAGGVKIKIGAFSGASDYLCDNGEIVTRPMLLTVKEVGDGLQQVVN